MGNYPELGFGIMRMPQRNGKIDWAKSQELIDEYMKGDFCYFDTHPAYMMTQSQRIIKEFVVKRYGRDQYFLANKMPYYGINTYEDYCSVFNRELIECGVEYFDYYLLHAVSRDVYEMHKELGGFDFLQELKRSGRVKNIGFSFHDKSELLEEILISHPEVDFVQLQINYLDWENPLIQSKACYEIAKKYKKEIIVMEPIKGGSLAKADNCSKDYARIALQFVKNLPGISVILSGMSEIEHIRENRITLSDNNQNKEINLSDYQDLISKIKKQNAIPCTECRYCVRECPKGVKIPDILSLMNTYFSPGYHDKTILGRMKILYKSLILGDGAAGKCIGCGKCEQRCPQKIPIRENLEKAKNMFEERFFYTSERNAQILIYLMREYGIRKIIVSPGATNASFAYSLQQDGFFEVYSAPDERSAAYMACGLAVESGEAVALSCTGATASRNYIPGLTEAFYRHIPVLAITSTQPPVRIGHNIPQVIDRSKMQNDIVKMSVEMPAVKDDDDEWKCVINANKALNELSHFGVGPVHINLVTTYSNDFSVKNLPHAKIIRRVQENDQIPDIPNGKLGIFCGAHRKWDSRLSAAVDFFCERYGAVVICDHTSNYVGNFRYTPSFLDKQIRESSLYDIDILIHIGDISGAYFPIRAKEVWRVHPNGEFCDTFRSLSYVFEMDELAFFEKCIEDLPEQIERIGKDKWVHVKGNTRTEPQDMPFSNAWIAFQTADKLPENAVLHLGILNSLRMWNYYRITDSVRVYSNTGGFGIDGCLSTLIGASLTDPKKLYFGVLGDLAFFYDMNALGNRHIGNNIRLLVINNGGGTEFKNYNHAASVFREQTDLYIAAKGHNGNKSKRLLKEYVESLGFIYKSACSKAEYLEILPDFLNSDITGSSVVVEVFTDSEDESEALRLLNETKENTGIVTAEDNTEIPEWLLGLSQKEVVLWGSGHCFIQNLYKVEQYSKVRYVCDNNSAKWDTEVSPGILCVSPDELKNMENIFVVIMLEDAKIAFDIAHQLQMLGICHFDILNNWLKYAAKMEWVVNSDERD